MNKLLALLAELLGEKYDDDTKAKLETAAKEAIESGASSATDSTRAEVKRLESELRKAERRADAAEAKLADASGETDARVVELRAQVDTHKARVADLEAEARRREVCARFERALGKASLPEAKRAAAIKLADLDGVELDEEAADGLAGSSKAIERLREAYGFLWEAADSGSQPDGEGSNRGGGPRNNAGAAPKPPKPGSDPAPEKLGAQAVADALRARGRKVRGAYGQSAAGAAGA